VAIPGWVWSFLLPFYESKGGWLVRTPGAATHFPDYPLISEVHTSRELDPDLHLPIKEINFNATYT
jgi:hypothetical protein